MNIGSSLRKPGWAKELRRNKKEEDIPDQITIIKKGTGGIPQPLSMKRPDMSGMDGGSRYTGDGEDNLMQPGKVAGDVHEGETVLSANTTQAFPPDVLKELIKQADEGTLDVNALRTALKMPEQGGYSSGSYGSPIWDENYPSSAPNARRDSSTGIGASGLTTGIGTTAIPGVQSQTRQITADQQPSVIQPLGIPKATGTVRQITAPPTTGTVRQVTPDQQPAVVQPIGVPKTLPTGGTTGTVKQVTVEPQKEQPPATITKIPVPPTTAVTPQTPVTPATTVNKYQQGFDQSLTRLQDVAGGNSDIDRNIANRNLRRFDTTAATDISVADQQAALQNNIPDSARAALGAEARSGVRSDRSELIGGLAESEQERALGANQAAAGLAMQGMAFEEDKNRYKDSADWKSYETAIAAGDFNTAAAAYKKITGSDISMDQMKLNQTYLNSKNAQDLTAGQISINNMKNAYGDAAWTSISSMINTGASLSAVNARLAEQGKPPISDADYRSMMDATPLGERTWERNMSYAKTLLEAGGAQNITAAAGIFNQSFPGTGIDFSKLITADNAATVNQGMSQLSDLIAAGMDYDAAIDVMKKNGTLTMLGMSEADVEKVYRGMKVNAIDEQWGAITESDWYKNQLNDDQRKDMSTFFTAVLSGQLDYKVQKEYTVTNKDGSTSTMYFNDAAAANSYGTSNGATMVATGKSKVTPITDVLEGSQGGSEKPVTPPTKRTEPLGTKFIEGGKIYQVIADGKTQEIVPDVNDPLSDNNIQIMSVGEANNPYYKALMDSAYQLVSGGHDIAGTFNSDTAATTAGMTRFRQQFEEYKDIPFEHPLIQRLKKDIETASTRSGTKVTIVKNGNSWDITVIK
jgi:hypothetical protein